MYKIEKNLNRLYRKEATFFLDPKEQQKQKQMSESRRRAAGMRRFAVAGGQLCRKSADRQGCRAGAGHRL